MSFPRYEKYKDSGVAWLGEIPASWATRRIKILFEIKKRIAGEEGYNVLSITQKGIRVKDIESNDGQLATDYSQYQFVEPGDFAMNHMDLLTGWVDIANTPGVTSPDYRVFSTRTPGDIHDKYFLYLFQNAYKRKIFYAFGQGASQLGRWRLPTEQFNDFVVPFPSMPEQVAIANFLNRETAKVDALVKEQTHLIELLKEKRQTVISHAVTKGLNPDACMKPSGVGWLGDIPAHWKVVKLRQAIEFQEGPGIMAIDFQDEGVPLIRVSGVQSRWASTEGCNYLDPEKAINKWGHFRLDEGDLIISASASMGTVCEVGASVVGAIPYTGLIRLKPKAGKSVKDFARALLGSSLFFMQIDQLKAGATIQHFGPTHLAQMVVTAPPIPEQAAIAQHVDEQNSRFDALIAEGNRAIELLQERRSALVSAAVTGRIDVRTYRTEEVATGCP